MKRILFDTSVYGKLIEDLEIVEKIGKLIPNKFVVYGAKIIREELRETPKKLKIEAGNKRILLLHIYDSFVKKEHHDLGYNKLIETLTEDYFKEYKKQQGSLSKRSMKNDLIIIAIATIYQLDIIISNDKKSMLSNSAINAYEKINKEYGLKNPIFKTYKEFKEEIKRFQNDI